MERNTGKSSTMAHTTNSIFNVDFFTSERKPKCMQKRSLSLDNLDTATQRKVERGNTIHGSALKSIKKRLGIKISKSNQDGLEYIPVGETRKPGNTLHAQLSASNLLERKEKKEEKPKIMPRDLRRRSRTGDNSTGHLAGPVNDHLKSAVIDGLPIRPRSFTESNEGYLTVDNASFDDSLDGHTSPYDTGDDVDGGPPDSERTRQEIDRLKRKIEKTKEQLQEMQNVKDESVKEYLESTESHAASQRNKMNFEKRNQKTNANIQSLQKKLEKYNRMLRDYGEGGAAPHGPRGVLRGMQDAVKAGASSASRAVTKPLESLNHLIKKDKKSSSVENVASLVVPSLMTGEGSTLQVDDTEKNFLSGASDDDNSSTSSTNQLFTGTHDSSTLQNLISPEDEEIQKFHCQGEREELRRLRSENEDMRELTGKLKDQVEYLAQNVQEERYKSQHLQCQVNDLINQCNDLTELHQNEIMALKQEIERAEERIECVDYRSAERAGEIEEALDSCVTRINKMELQQQQQQQILLSVDGFDGSGAAKVLLSKSLSLVISLFAIVLVIVSTCARMVMPFCSTRLRMVTTVFTIFILVVFWRNTDHGKVRDYARLLFNSSLPVVERLKMVTRLGGLMKPR